MAPARMRQILKDIYPGLNDSQRVRVDGVLGEIRNKELGLTTLRVNGKASKEAREAVKATYLDNLASRKGLAKKTAGMIVRLFESACDSVREAAQMGRGVLIMDSNTFQDICKTYEHLPFMDDGDIRITRELIYTCGKCNGYSMHNNKEWCALGCGDNGEMVKGEISYFVTLIEQEVKLLVVEAPETREYTDIICKV